MISLNLMLCLLAIADCTPDAFHHDIFQKMFTNGILPKVWHKYEKSGSCGIKRMGSFPVITVVKNN